MTSEGNTGDESRERQRRGRGREEEVGRGGGRERELTQGSHTGETPAGGNATGTPRDKKPRVKGQADTRSKPLPPSGCGTIDCVLG